MEALPQQDGIPTKRCPFCAQLIPEPERQCRYCHEYLDPSLRGELTGGAAYWEGDHLKVPLGGFIRCTHCLVCGRLDGTRLICKTFWYVPGFLRFFLPRLYLLEINTAIPRERQEIDVPVCPDCDERWKWWSTMIRLYGTLALVALPTVFMMLGIAVYPRHGGGYGVIAGLLAWSWGLFGSYALGLRRFALTTRRIDGSSALLRLPNASLVQTAWEEEK